MLPQSGPLSNVTVCAALSPFVHVTVPPALIVVAAGVNAKFATATCAPAAGPTVAQNCCTGLRRLRRRRLGRGTPPARRRYGEDESDTQAGYHRNSHGRTPTFWGHPQTLRVALLFACGSALGNAVHDKVSEPERCRLRTLVCVATPTPGYWTVIVPFMKFGWILQIQGYEPAASNLA